MKKKGFTLAEVLITLGIIGVVAALTLPTLSTNAQSQANASKLASTVSDLENAFGLILMTDSSDPLQLHDMDLSSESLYTKISKNMKTNGDTTASKEYGADNPFSGITLPKNTVFMTKSGAMVFIDDKQAEADDDANGNVDKYFGNAYIDVNGKTKPNKLGKDVFSFHLGEDGILYPMDDATKKLVKNGYKL